LVGIQAQAAEPHTRVVTAHHNTREDRMATVHVYPDNDLIEHDTDGGDCLCGPKSEGVKNEDGSYGWVIVHHSLDGREAHE
jgi:hypothetical protein